jgi:hypothetical protein
MGINSLKDKKLVVVHFDGGDNGEVETFLGMESIYTETAYGTHRNDYGAKYNDVAKPRITVMKATGKAFTVAEVRDFLRWTTGARHSSYLDLLKGGVVKFSFLGRVINVLQHKLDARTIGFTIEFEANNPWAWSPKQFVSRRFYQQLSVVDDGVLTKADGTLLTLSDDNSVYNSEIVFNVENDGIIEIDNSVVVEIDNLSDDLYSYVYLDTKFTNINSDYISINNETIGEETIIKNMSKNEVITLSSGQFIISNSSYDKIFGDDFNFVWPRLAPGYNNLIIDGGGNGTAKFTYRYPMKVGDCAMDISTYGSDSICDCNDGMQSYDTIRWQDIVDTPTTIEGYGITNAYNKNEVDYKIDNIDVGGGGSVSIDEEAFNKMLEDVLG